MNFGFIADHKIIDEKFAQIYYNNMTTSGIANNLELFDENCKCTLNNEEFTGGYGILVRFAKSGINRFNYRQLSGNVQPINDSNNNISGFIVSVMGVCQLISFQNTLLKETNFSDTFYISNLKNQKIVNYIGKFM